jgi:site-specific recombinase XerD
MNKQNTPLGIVFDVFQLFNRSEMKSDDTIRWYNYAIPQMFKSKSGIPIETLACELTEEGFRRYCASLRDRRFKGRVLSSSTINGHVRCIRAFCSWLYRNEYTEIHLLKDFRPPRVLTQTIDVLSDVEVTLLLEAASMYRRDVAIVSLMLDSGLRASELTGAKIEDLNINRATLKVLGKGRRERIVSFGRTTSRYITSYMLHERPNDCLSERIFVSSIGRDMNRGSLYQLFVRLRGRSGISRLHPHLLRHSFASAFLLAGGSAFLLKEALGHSSMDMVLHYLHFTGVQVAEATRSLSTIDRLSSGDRRSVAPPMPGQFANQSPGELWISQLKVKS